MKFQEGTQIPDFVHKPWVTERVPHMRTNIFTKKSLARKSTEDCVVPAMTCKNKMTSLRKITMTLECHFIISCLLLKGSKSKISSKYAKLKTYGNIWMYDREVFKNNELSN